MGEYNGDITSGVIATSFGDIDFLINSTGAFGDPVPQGEVDTTLGEIYLNLKDLYLTTSGFATGTVSLWDESTSTIDLNVYDSSTNTISFGWSDTRSFALSGFGNQSIPYSIEINGIASTVPIPAGIWLMSSGLLGLLICAHRNQNHSLALKLNLNKVYKETK